MAPGPGPRAPRLKRPHASPHQDFYLCSVIKIERRAWRKASPQTPNNSTPGIQVCISGHRVAQMHAAPRCGLCLGAQRPEDGLGAGELH